MKLTAGQAAKATGRSIPTIVRAYEKQRLSGERLPDGKGYLFEASELFRVFPAVTSPPEDDTPLGTETPNNDGVLGAELRFLRERLEALEADRVRERALLADQIKLVSGQLADVREDRDHWREQAERATRLIAPPVETPAAPPPVIAERPSWLSRLLGRGKG